MKLFDMLKQGIEYAKERYTGTEYKELRENGYVVFYDGEIVGGCLYIVPEHYEPNVIFLSLATKEFFITFGGNCATGANEYRKMTFDDIKDLESRAWTMNINMNNQHSTA